MPRARRVAFTASSSSGVGAFVDDARASADDASVEPRAWAAARASGSRPRMTPREVIAAGAGRSAQVAAHAIRVAARAIG